MAPDKVALLPLVSMMPPWAWSEIGKLLGDIGAGNQQGAAGEDRSRRTAGPGCLGTGQRATSVGPECEPGPEERIAVGANASNQRRKPGRKGGNDGVGRRTDDGDRIARWYLWT